MSDSKTAVDEELKTVKLEIAKLDLRMKKLDLRDRPRKWRSISTNPIVVGAFITAYISLVIGLLNSCNDEAQQTLTNRK
jgi:hypothetical protein